MSGANLVLDTNVIIYYLKGNQATKPLLQDNNITISYITAVEVLGYWKNSKKDIATIEKLFSSFTIVYSNERIKDQAVDLKRKYRMKTPDSIIGATAMFLDLPVVTSDSDLYNVPEITSIAFKI